MQKLIMAVKKTTKTHFPRQLHQILPRAEKLKETSLFLKKTHLHTVCQEAQCPNRLFCFAKKRATFLTLGKYCSRNCLFCAVSKKAKLLPPDPQEPSNIALCAKKLKLNHIVITMVTRDDLKDGGAYHLAQIIKLVKKQNPQATTEILTSDFSGNLEALEFVLQQKPDIFNHNLETVERLTCKIRDQKASYEQSLKILTYAKKSQHKRLIKSGLMIGLGETFQEIKNTIRDLALVGCDIVTIGQYLSPGKKHYPIKKYWPLKNFRDLADFGRKIGIKTMLASPLVRSSLNAEELFRQS